MFLSGQSWLKVRKNKMCILLLRIFLFFEKIIYFKRFKLLHIKDIHVSS